MSAKIIDGKAIASELRAKLKAEVAALTAQHGRPPGLAVVLVGQNPASEVYVHHKRAACLETGILAKDINLPETLSEASLLSLIDELNADPSIDGILVQLPLPAHIDDQKVIERIHPNKDVDGFHPYNLGRLAQRQPLLRPCTPYGVIKLLKSTGISLVGITTTIVGRSKIVGLPMFLELLMEEATITMCHSRTKNLKEVVSQAELLIVAMGRHGVVQSDWVKPGAVVIDVGIHRAADGKLRGDIDFDSAKLVASYITPVPGGVGPMTIAILLENTVVAYRAFTSRQE